MDIFAKAPSGWLSRKLILIMGKGGVGKSTVAQAAAQHLAAQGKRTLLCHLSQVVEKEQFLNEVSPNLWEIHLNASESFKEYVILKIKLKSLYTLFLGNTVTKYLEKAAPGVREMVLLGKVWFERLNYDHVVVDMPSSGYALTMINTPRNFADLFPGGPIHRDAEEMLVTFNDPQETAFVTVSLAEEMPIQESLELSQNLSKIIRDNPPWLVFNRLIRLKSEAKKLYSEKWPKLSVDDKESPYWLALDYLVSKEITQTNLRSEYAQTSKELHQGILELGECASSAEELKISSLEDALDDFEREARA